MAATSSPLHKSRERRFQINPSTTQNLSFTPLLLFIVLCASFVLTGSAEEPPILTSDFENSYSRHCDHIVPQSPSRSHGILPSGSGVSDFQIGYFRGGNPLFNQTPTTGGAYRPQFLLFRPYSTGATFTDGVCRCRAALNLRDSMLPYSGRRSLRLVRFRGPRFPLRGRRVSFALKGFWSETSRKLCMVGSEHVPYGGTVNIFPVVLKLNYPHNSNINSSLISGSLESLDDNGSSNYFSPISILALSQDSNYDYTLIGKENGNGCLNGENREGFLALPNNERCSILGGIERLELVYGGDCKGVNCNPLGGNFGYAPNYMFYHRTRCDEGNKWKLLLGFSNSNYSGNRFPFEPSTTFIAEGEWNEKENQFCAVVCRILNYTKSFDNAYVGNCSTGFSLRFPVSLSLRNMSNVVGEIWSKSATNSSGHLDKIEFQSFNEELLDLLGVKYEYTVIDTLRETCVKKNVARGKGKKYPNEHSSDMRFDMSVRNSKGQVASGYSAPFYVASQLYRYQFFQTSSPHLMQADFSAAPNSSLVNISYKISFTPPPDFKFNRDSSLSNAVEISAEGTYDRDTGVLCMTGCLHPGSNPQNPLSFGRLELYSSSIYTGQAAASIWRINLEITMVLISNTLTCVFVWLAALLYKISHGCTSIHFHCDAACSYHGPHDSSAVEF